MRASLNTRKLLFAGTCLIALTAAVACGPKTSQQARERTDCESFEERNARNQLRRAPDLGHRIEPASENIGTACMSGSVANSLLLPSPRYRLEIIEPSERRLEVRISVAVARERIRLLDAQPVADGCNEAYVSSVDLGMELELVRKYSASGMKRLAPLSEATPRKLEVEDSPEGIERLQTALASIDEHITHQTTQEKIGNILAELDYTPLFGKSPVERRSFYSDLAAPEIVKLLQEAGQNYAQAPLSEHLKLDAVAIQVAPPAAQ
jgi:hypothetical protein